MLETEILSPLEERVLDYYNFAFFECVKICHNPEEAKDFAQDVAYKILTRADQDLGAEYVRKTVRSVISNSRRDMRKHYTLNLEFIVEPAVKRNFTDAYDTKETIESIQEILTPEEWAVINMRAEGYSLSEIAEQSGMKIPAVQRMIKTVQRKAKHLNN